MCWKTQYAHDYDPECNSFPHRWFDGCMVLQFETDHGEMSLYKVDLAEAPAGALVTKLLFYFQYFVSLMHLSAELCPTLQGSLEYTIVSFNSKLRLIFIQLTITNIICSLFTDWDLSVPVKWPNSRILLLWPYSLGADWLPGGPMPQPPLLNLHSYHSAGSHGRAKAVFAFPGSVQTPRPSPNARSASGSLTTASTKVNTSHAHRYVL